MDFQNSIVFARQLDEQDTRKLFRTNFFLISQHKEKDAIYLTGNSHRLQHKTTKGEIN
ncbi:MAG: hypothetical protein JST21_15835 [Bacteroidetes bacterium]|nr:hypothetical protein [Bacteroidota bacterium]